MTIALAQGADLSTPAKDRRKVGKTLGRQRAIELYADQAATFARAKDDGRAEAALIARHGLGLS